MTEICRICGFAKGNKVHTFREMMFGTYEEFKYRECVGCGTLQLTEIPDLALFYPPTYYSFASVDGGISTSPVTRLAARLAAKRLMTGKGLLGRQIVEHKTWARDSFPDFFVNSDLNISFSSRILDVGCGSGYLLDLLKFFGFRRLTGIDSFAASDTITKSGVRILKREIKSLEPGYDIIMFHHSLEHFIDPVEALNEANSLLNPDKYCIVRIPLISFAWEKYGADWVQLDAPRHIHLFTENGFKMVAEKAGFKVIKIVYDSTAFQFTGSELYMRGIPLITSLNNRNYLSELFGDEQLRLWGKEAEALNEQRRGDQACFYLQRISS